MSDKYVWIQGTLEVRREESIKFNGIWIGRNCINGIDNNKINEADIDDEIEIRVFQWLAEKEDLEYRNT